MTNKQQTASRFLHGSERLLYYLAALALLVTIGYFLVSTAISEVPDLLHTGAFNASITILDRVLFVFIFAELLHSIRIIIQEDRILADPFLLIGIIAVIRRILVVSAETQTSSAADFQQMLVELAVLAVLVLALGVSYFLVRRVERQANTTNNKELES
jgi:uncharacterized membrane protein (DUF373 family)